MMIKRPLSKQPIPQTATRVFNGKIFDVYQWQQTLFDGSTTTFEKIKRTDTVNVLPVTPEGKIVLSKQEQPGLEPFVGVIGGRVDEGEDPLTAAKRELKEETGMVSQEWVLWDVIQLTEKVDWAIYTFVARDCTKSVDIALEAGEKIELFEVDFDEFVRVASQKNFRDVEVSLKLFQVLNNPDQLLRTKRLFR